MNNIQVKINEGQSLWKPKTGILLKEGDVLTVPNITFWRRRLKDGTISLVQLPEKKPKADQTSKKTKKNKPKNNKPSDSEESKKEI